MYKNLSFDALVKLTSTFFETLAKILKKNRYLSLKDYIRKNSKQGDAVYHFESNACIWRTVFDGDEVIFYDERERIELHADTATLSRINSLVIDPSKLAKQRRQSISMQETLQQEFLAGAYQAINNKPYLVYDIETALASNDATKTEFYLGYAYVVQDAKASYRYIDKDNLTKFVEYLIEFDGYIVGFNNLAFDNPVALAQGLRLADRYTEEDYKRNLALINAKSLDLYHFILGLTKKRIGLDKLSKSLIGVGKSLESGAQVQGLWELYQDGDQKALTTLKSYCKNDVHMTYLSLWMILRSDRLGIDDESFQYSFDEFIDYANKEQSGDRYGIGHHKRKNIFSN